MVYLSASQAPHHITIRILRSVYIGPGVVPKWRHIYCDSFLNFLQTFFRLMLKCKVAVVTKSITTIPKGVTLLMADLRTLYFTFLFWGVLWSFCFFKLIFQGLFSLPKVQKSITIDRGKWPKHGPLPPHHHQVHRPDSKEQGSSDAAPRAKDSGMATKGSKLRPNQIEN